MSQVSYGTITISDLTDITNVFLQYGLALSDVTVTNSYSFNETGEVGWFILTEDTSVDNNKIYFRLDSGVYKVVINPTGNPYTQGWYESSPYPTWTSGFQIWIRQIQIKEGIDEPEYGTPYLDTPVNQINDSIGAINNSIYTISTNITGLDNRLETFFWPGDSNYSGAFAVAKTAEDGIDYTNANTYGFNTRVATGLVSVGYNKIPLSEWGINEGLKMYYPILDNEIVVDNKLGMQLLANSLTFYKANNSSDKALEIATDGINFYGSNQNKADATLSSNGLKLVEGGIEAGEPNTNDFVYLSSTDFVGPIEPFYRLTLDTEIENGKTYYEYDEENDTYTAISSPTIEDIGSYYEYYTPSQGTIAIDNFVKTNWRQIIGTNFAVDSDGNLYASNADISGIIHAVDGEFTGTIYAESGSIGGFTIGSTELYSQDKTSAVGLDEGTYIGPNGFGISGGDALNTTYFTQDAVSIGGLLEWTAASGEEEQSNLSIYATEIYLGTLGDALVPSNLNFLQDANANDDFAIKTLLTNTITEISSHKTQIEENKEKAEKMIADFDNYYRPYITTTENNQNGYIQLKRKDNSNASSIKITDTKIEISINQQTITAFEGTLMRTTFGEFENLRMKANGYTNNSGYLTWIARSNGHLSLKVVK